MLPVTSAVFTCVYTIVILHLFYQYIMMIMVFITTIQSTK